MRTGRRVVRNRILIGGVWGLVYRVERSRDVWWERRSVYIFVFCLVER